jgi:hypothetical protein
MGHVRPPLSRLANLRASGKGRVPERSAREFRLHRSRRGARDGERSPT